MSKEFLLMVSEEDMMALQALQRLGIKFLEVQGMGLGGNNAAMLLACPIKPPVTPMPAPEQPAPAAQQENEAAAA